MGVPSENASTAKQGVRPLARPRLVAVWEGGYTAHELAEGEVVTLGRSSENTLAIEHASVSRRHAIVRFCGQTTIEDLGSANGTRVAGRPAAPHSPVAIAPGSIVEIGAVTLLVYGPDEDVGLAKAPAGTDAAEHESGPMRRIEELVLRVAPSDLSVVLRGETGVGKGVWAERVHAQSRRAHARMLSLNCGALPEALLDAELFGHAKGAFTGAATASPGLVEAAHGGTLFLDEIGELSLASQVRLLRVVENREVLRIGEREPRKVDVRFIAATHKDLDAAVRAGTFRQDLLYRLNGITITIPPLRDRSEQISILARQFIREACERSGRPELGLSPEALAALGAHPWPGNVRELRNVIERAVVLADGDAVTSETLGLGSPIPPLDRGALRSELDRVERDRIVLALERAGGNQIEAARLLGISRRTLLRRLDEHELPRPRKVT